MPPNKDKGSVDLVIWNEAHNVYRHEFQNDILALIPPELKGTLGGVFVRTSDQISNEDRILFQTVARIIISDSSGTLADHVKRAIPAKVLIPYINKTHANIPSLTSTSRPKQPGLLKITWHWVPI